MRKVLLLPGWMTALKLYESNCGFDFKIGNLDKNAIDADYVIGLSLGALVVLQNIDRIKGRIILINPAFPKRNIISWFISWVRYITAEGLFLERQKFTMNPLRFLLTLLSCVKLFGKDFSKTLDAIEKNRLIIIRGNNDRYFCDNKAVEFINSKGIKLIEVEGGHNWSEDIEKTLLSL